MPLNLSKGNMYPFVTHTWNTIKGRCPHGCSYCYMKRFGKQKPIRFDEVELKTDLGKGNFIFIGSSCDMWAEDVPEEWILNTLKICAQYPNKYLFQSKNPIRMFKMRWALTFFDSVFGTTIETNRHYSQMGNAPQVKDRAIFLGFLSNKEFKTMVTIEPIIDFDVDELINLIALCNPEWVNIGADSQNSGLPEPSASKINELIKNLRRANIEVKIKDNLKRLTG